MTDAPRDALSPREYTEARRSQLAEAREHALRLFEGGATGVQVAAFLSEAIDALLLEIVRNSLEHLSTARRQLIEEHAAIVAIGGSGRGELAPYSDSDLMFLYRGPAAVCFPNFVAHTVRECWDAGIKLGHSVRTIGEAVSLARQEPQIATALVEARLLWGSTSVYDTFRRSFRRRAVDRRKRVFIEASIAARSQERQQHGATGQQLEPDIKRSLGGLRDVHLIRWIAFARYGTSDIESLRLKGGLRKDDARRLITAHEFLLRLRIELHFHSGRSQDFLSRQEQLRIADKRGVGRVAGQRPVERFMQDYFRHSMAIANVAQRFAALESAPRLGPRVLSFANTRRLNRIYKLGGDVLDVSSRHRSEACRDLESVLRLYQTAALYNVKVSPQVEEHIKQCLPQLEESYSDGCNEVFLDILGSHGTLAPALRSMHNTGVLDLVLPEMAHARCLLQFNEYHSYTVDEHTLRTIEAARSFEHDSGPLGVAYRNIRHKAILHLALLLHDLGKGYERDHSEVGREIAATVAARMQLSNRETETLVFLVHKHLLMSHLAFRRNTSDPEILVPFSREVGTPETLRMLYVLSAADLQGVGPDVWTDWKADLLAEMYDRVLLVLSGKNYGLHETERLEELKSAVQDCMQSAQNDAEHRPEPQWIDEHLDALPLHYLLTTIPKQIADDLRSMRRLQPRETSVVGHYDNETGTVDYRIIAHPELSEGCFHKVAGVLTAKRLEILSAQISTSADGTVIDCFRVLDGDYPGNVPESRMDDIQSSIQSVLIGETAVPHLFQRHKRFASTRPIEPISGLPTRVSIDNDSSDRCTIVDVFAHDRPGLLYTISQAIYEMGLSVLLAKIATHSDQVVDVFYVVDRNGLKFNSDDELRALQAELESRVEQFEQGGYRAFMS